jgi:Exonuclease
MVVRVVDIETTGTDPESDAVIEIASVDVLADGSITNRLSTLVRPGMPVPPEASAVHHLIDEDLAGAPLSTCSAAQTPTWLTIAASNGPFSDRCWVTCHGFAPTAAPCASGRTSLPTTTRRSATVSVTYIRSGSIATR